MPFLFNIGFNLCDERTCFVDFCADEPKELGRYATCPSYSKANFVEFLASFVTETNGNVRGYTSETSG